MIARPGEPVCRYTVPGQYVQHAGQPVPTLKVRLGFKGLSRVHHLFLFGGPVSARSTPDHVAGLFRAHRQALEIALSTLLPILNTIPL